MTLSVFLKGGSLQYYLGREFLASALERYRRGRESLCGGFPKACSFEGGSRKESF
jgi:hypothetical protein